MRLSATSTRIAGILSAISFGVALIGSGSVAQAYTGEKDAQQAKITIAEARAAALKVRPGKITDEELEKERGGSGLRYSFDIKSGSRVYEVGIDAMTGHVLENAPEGENPD